MNFRVEWDNDARTALHFSYSRHWTWDDLAESVREGMRLMDTVDHMVDHLYDVSQATTLPTGAFSGFQRLRQEKAHPRLGRRVLVGANRLLVMFSQMLLKVYPEMQRNFALTETLSDARQFLQQSPARGRESNAG